MNRGYAAWAARWRVPLGFLLGVAYLIFCQPTALLLVAGSLLALAGLLLRACAAGFLDKNRRLATAGPYRYTRNPLYLGSFLLGSGFVLAGGRWALAVAFFAFFLLVYWPVLDHEEAYLRQRFGQDYDRYAKSVSVFFPTRRGDPTAEESFRWERYVKNREYEAALGYAAGVAFLVLKLLLR